MTNNAVRLYAAGKGIRLWQIAEKLGIADCNFSRKLRKELPQEERDRIFAIIDELEREED